MRKKWFVGIFVALISMTCISGCGVSYKDYTDIQQTETETEQTGGIETNREYIGRGCYEVAIRCSNYR